MGKSVVSQSSHGPLYPYDYKTPADEAEVYTLMLTLPYRHYTTPKFGQKYYKPLRDAILGRVLSLADKHFHRCEQERLWRIKLSLRDLGYLLGPDTAAALEPLEDEVDITRRPSVPGSALEPRVDAYISGAMPAGERAVFLDSEFPGAVSAILRHSFYSPQLVAAVSSMIHKALEVCVYHIKRIHEPLPAAAMKQLRKLLMGEYFHTGFFDNYGKVKPQHSEARAAGGYVARVPNEGASHYFVSALNHFHRLGGYDAILLRLQYTNALAKLANKGQLTAQLAEELCPDVEAVISASVNADLDSLQSHTSVGSDVYSGAGSAAGSSVSAPGTVVRRYLPCGAASPTSIPRVRSVQTLTGPLGVAQGADGGEEATIYAVVLHAAHMCYTPQFAKKTVAPLKAAIMERMLTFSEYKKLSSMQVNFMRKALAKLGPLTDVPGDQKLAEWATTICEGLVEAATGQTGLHWDKKQITASCPTVRLFGHLVAAWGQEKANEHLFRAVIEPSMPASLCNLNCYWFLGILEGIACFMYCPRLLRALERSGVSARRLLRRLVSGYKPSDLLPPLHVAAQQNEGELCLLAVDAGVPVDGKDSLGRTALLVAASAGCRESCLALLESGASPTASVGIVGLKPFHTAVLNGHVKVCELLLDYCNASNESRAKALLDEKVGDSGDTALHLAAKRNHGSMASWLLERGACPSLTNQEGRTPLQLATIGRLKSAAIALLGFGVRFSASEVEAAAARHNERLLWADDKFYDALGQEVALPHLDRWNVRLARALSAELAALGPQAQTATPIAPAHRGFVRWACSLPLYVLQKYGGPSWAPPVAAAASSQAEDERAIGSEDNDAASTSEGVDESDNRVSAQAASRRDTLISALGADAWERRKHVVVAFFARRKAMRARMQTDEAVTAHRV